MKGIIYQKGFNQKQKHQAVSLYHEAFGDKIALAVKSREKRLKLLHESFESDYCFTALKDNQLIGIAGFQTSKGSLTNGLDYSQLIKQLGFIKGNKAALVFSLFDRKADENQLLMDGICVDSRFRSQGIGKSLLDRVIKYATNKHFSNVRLDVINTNPRAMALYQRYGFETVKTENFPYLEKYLGFSGSTTMLYYL